MRINLVESGIFPIIYDKDGSLIQDDSPDTGFKSPGVIQGEGKLIGVPSLFIRTSGCNLRCVWYGLDGEGSFCDTPYSSHKPEKAFWAISDIIQVVKNNTNNGVRHIVISGGEPTMQTKPLIELLKRLKEEGYHTTIETNAIIYNDEIAQYTDLVSMSPKLASSDPIEDKFNGSPYVHSQKWEERHKRDRRNIDTIQKYINKKRFDGDFQLKFVVSCMNDIIEIENDFLGHLNGWTPQDVVIMPEGTDTDTLSTHTRWLLEEVVKRGWRFSPRLHIDLWGHARRV